MSTREEKLQKFASDPSVMEAVYDTLLDSFIESGRDGDVYVKAAAQIALHNLNDAWTKIERHKAKQTTAGTSGVQIGL